MLIDKNIKKSLFRGFFCFRKGLFVLFLITSFTLFSQEKLTVKREIQSKEIEIFSDGLDDIVIENSLNNQLEVVLFDENPNTHRIFITEEKGVLKVSFKLNFEFQQTQVFRKYITKRLQRAKVVLKIPKHKNVFVYGQTIGVEAKSYQGDLSIFIDKGNVKLHQVKKSVLVKLFLGNVSAQISKKNAINIKTTKGKILIDSQNYKSPFYNKIANPLAFKFNIESINANVVLITK
ncbi:DUF4097 domain-containing protein [Tenacibaculum insulae]